MFMAGHSTLGAASVVSLQRIVDDCTEREENWWHHLMLGC